MMAIVVPTKPQNIKLAIIFVQWQMEWLLGYQGPHKVKNG